MKKDSGVAEKAARCKDGERTNTDSRKADWRSISSGDPLHPFTASGSTQGMAQDFSFF